MLAQTLLAGTFLSLSYVWATPFAKRQNGTSMIYGFDVLPATDDLVWRPCFDSFSCAKLKVPLDYENEAVGTTHVSFVKWSSNTTSPNATQDIVYNPGGPGASGIIALTQDLDAYLDAFGTDYNLVSFDPRGVNNSGPDLSCFRGQKGTSMLYDQEAFLPLDADDIKTYRKAFQDSAAWGDFCTDAHSGANDTAKYANTIATATDMLHYTELLAKSKGQDPKKSELWYYGISYGTVLGTTFASLFPSRVGRMIVDGVVDAEDYYQGEWKANLPDADKGIEFFFQSCHEAGKSVCKSWADSPEAIKARFDAALKSLAEDPLPVSNQIRPDIVTIEDLKILVLQAPYIPVLLFPLLDETLIGIEQRNFDDLFLLTSVGTIQDTCSDELSQLYSDFEPLPFIHCTDANNRFNLSTFESWQDYANQLINQSHYLGDTWAVVTAILCRKLNIRAPASQVFEGYPSANNTLNPLLFASTKVDPVTPLRAAEKMQARFAGAGLLVQNSVGHTTSSTPSKCTYEYFQKYMKDASLPPAGTSCDPDYLPFQGKGPGLPNIFRRGLHKRIVPRIGL